MVWLLNEAQWELYNELRPPERMENEIRKAVREGKIDQIKPAMGALKITVAPSFYYLAIFW